MAHRAVPGGQRLERLVVTTRRLLVREGVRRRHGLDVPLDRIAAVHVRRTRLGRLLGHGSLVVETDTDGEVGFRGLSGVERVRVLLHQAAATAPGPPAR